MPQIQSRTNATSDDKQQLGFEYQYQYFILSLLKMEHGDSVGYEALDDVHRISTNGSITYIQVKHTINVSPDGSLVGLPRFSPDLWKSLANWAKLIADPAENRKLIQRQKEFVESARFLLIVNRNVDSNIIVQKAKDVAGGKADGKSVKRFLDELWAETSDKTIQDYISDVNKLSPTIIQLFFARIVVISTDDLRDDIWKAIRGKMISECYVEDIYHSLYAELKDDFFNTVKQHKHQVISYDAWIKRFTATFEEYRTTLLPRRTYNPILPKHLEDQVFVKELVEIGAVDMSEDGLAEIADYTRLCLTLEFQLNDWYEDGRISTNQKDDFHREAVTVWRRIHQSCHRMTRRNATLDINNALSCFDETMREQLLLRSVDIGLGLSNGEFIRLANEQKVGWRYRWKEC